MRTTTTRRRYAAAAVACCTALLLSAAVAFAAAPARGTATSGVSTCSAASTPHGLQRICERLSAAKIEAFFRSGRGCRTRSPRPTAGPATAMSCRSCRPSSPSPRCSTTPHSGRVFFEQLIRGNLDLGRPDKASLIFDRRVRLRGRRPTPSRWRTRVLCPEVTPSIHVDYKHKPTPDCSAPRSRQRPIRPPTYRAYTEHSTTSRLFLTITPNAKD